MAKRKRNDLRTAAGLAVGGAAALQGVKLLKDVRAGANLTGHVPAFVGIGIAGATTKIALDMIEGSAYPIKKRVRKKRR